MKSIADTLNEVARIGQLQQTIAARAARISTIVKADGPQAARMVAEPWETTGTDPTWRELSDAMGWPLGPAHQRQEQTAIIKGLTRADWLDIGREPRSLRPGPRYYEGEPR